MTPKTFRSVRERRGLGLNLDYVTRSISSIVDEREVDAEGFLQRGDGGLAGADSRLAVN